VATDRDIADIADTASALDAANADTNITINQGARNAPPPPEFRAATRPRAQVVSERPATPTQANTPTPYRAPTPQVSTRTVSRVNWGGIVKGALVVTAVAVVAIVGAGIVAGFVGSALTSLGASAAAGGALAATTSTISSVGTSLAGAAEAGLTSIGGFVSGLFSGLFGAGTATAATTTTLAANTGAISTGVGALAAGGIAAAAAPMAKAVLSTPMVDHVTQTVVSTPPAPTGLEDGGHSATLAAKKSVLAEHASQADTGHDSHNVTDEMMAQKATSTASKIAHHAAHSEETTEIADAPDAPEEAAPHQRSRTALAQGLQSQSKWAERTSHGSNYSHALQSTGSHAEAVHAAAPAAPTVAPRDAAFTEALNHERAELDATLGHPVR
jgi:hypothetical protein